MQNIKVEEIQRNRHAAPRDHEIPSRKKSQRQTVEIEPMIEYV